ncbi:MAG TPA: HAD family phosphatase [Candidatus Bathyarchaeia archaeon]|nr:HAD family phosphatase [Candidatus Bathyarchaeia archaeon]
MIKGIIFDVDGVIIDTEEIHFKAFRKVLKAYGYHLTKSAYKRYFSGKSIKGGMLSLLSEVKVRFTSNPDDFIFKVSQGGIQLNKIGKLVAKPILACTTGLEKVLIKEVLKHHRLEDYFSVQITAEQYVQSKPHPECYRAALSRMKLKPDDAIGIEDTPSGIKALNRAKIFSLGLTTTHSKKDLVGAKMTVDSLMDLVN